MRLFNFDGMTIFGPGSEWLWTMAQFLALVVTGVAIVRQLRAQRWANDLKLVSRLADEMLKEEMIRNKLAALIHIAEKQPGLSPSMEFVANWFDGTAETIYGGFLSRELATRFWGDLVQRWWAVAQRSLAEARSSDPRAWEAFQRWAGDAAAHDRKRGFVTDFGPAAMNAYIAESIPYFIGRLRIQQEMRGGTIPVWPTAPSEGTVADAAD